MVGSGEKRRKEIEKKVSDSGKRKRSFFFGLRTKVAFLQRFDLIGFGRFLAEARQHRLNDI